MTPLAIVIIEILKAVALLLAVVIPVYSLLVWLSDRKKTSINMTQFYSIEKNGELEGYNVVKISDSGELIIGKIWLNQYTGNFLVENSNGYIVHTFETIEAARHYAHYFLDKNTFGNKPQPATSKTE